MACERGAKKEEFCAEPGKPCDCENNYYTICDPGWTNYTYPQFVNRQPNPYTYQERYEAHHIVCVSSIMTQLYDKPEVQRVVLQTVWCINNSVNMKAMPLFGHTVQYYCSIGPSALRRFIRGDIDPPDFANIPQHDWDHDGDKCYLEEVDDAVRELASQIEKVENDPEHQYTGDDLAYELGELSKGFRKKLYDRGQRNGGTHDSWQEGRDVDGSTKWCRPFSMASTANLKGFPVPKFNSAVQEWVDRIAKALRGGG
jgi:hypothetical protein